MKFLQTYGLRAWPGFIGVGVRWNNVFREGDNELLGPARARENL
jgi:hypothetical protein